jgi:hypothetical protein
MSEIERLKKQETNLRQRIAELGTKQTAATATLAEKEQRRQSFLAEAGEGSGAARASLRKLDADIVDAKTDVDIFAAAVAKSTAELADVVTQRARAERAAAITSLENEISALRQPDTALQQALEAVTKASTGLFSAASVVTDKLAEIDSSRWGPAFAGEVRLAIQSSITAQLNLLFRPKGWPTPLGVSDLLTGKLTAITAQLRYESGEWQSAGKGEQLFRAAHNVTGIRQVDLPMGAVIALRPDEAAKFVEGGALVLVDDEAEVAPTPTEVPDPPEPERPARGERILNAY